MAEHRDPISTDDLAQQVLAWHAWLDAHPEPAWQETQTTAYLVEQLTALGARAHQVEDRTGALVEIGDGPRWIGIRADLDAIWMGDDDGYAVHSCGHSAHMAMALGAARLVADAGLPEGTGLRLLLQPAEEPGTGALDLIERGALEGMTHLFGMHIRPVEELDTGWFAPALHSGASESGLVTVKGEDAHGARPHLGRSAIDAIVALHQALPAVRFRPGESWSAKITRIRAGGASTNVIPGDGTAMIDLRAQRNEVRVEAKRRIDAVVAGIAQAYGVEMGVDWHDSTPAAEVHPEAAALLRAAITEVVGTDRLAEEIVTPGADDFHYYAQARPDLRSAMLCVGVAATPGLHHPKVSYDREPLPVAAQVLASARRLTLLSLYSVSLRHPQITPSLKRSELTHESGVIMQHAVSRRSALKLGGLTLGGMTMALASAGAATASPTLATSRTGLVLPPGELVPIRQGQGQPGQWADCGPVSVVIMLLAMGVTPDHWDPADNVPAIIDIQLEDHMNLPAVDSPMGTTAANLTDGLESYGLRTSTVKSTDAVLAAARNGQPSIVNGMTLYFGWPQNARIPVGHWLVVAGYDPRGRRVPHPRPHRRRRPNDIHRVTATQIREFMVARGRILAVTARVLPPSA